MDRVFCWWINVNLKTRLISIVILVVSILMSGISFSVLASVQAELFYADSRFCRDLTTVSAHHIAFLLQDSNTAELKNFIEQLYVSTSSMRYIRLFDITGKLLFSFPASSSLFQKVPGLTIGHPISSNNIHNFFVNVPIAGSFMRYRYSFADSVIPILQRHSNWGFLQLGLAYSPGAPYSTKVAQDFSLIIFVVVWLMFITGIAFNFLAIARPIRKILMGLQDVASGNFSCHINDTGKGQMSDLIISFNAMSSRLLSYEKKNVIQLISEKARIEALVSTIADGAILLDTELRLLFVNQVAVKAFHWPNKDLIGENIFQYLPIHVNEALLPILNSMIHSNCLDNRLLKTQEVSVNLHYESLKTFRFLLSTVVSCKSRGLDGVVITIQDVTREAQLNGAKSQFISNVSHELRTPLCNIRSFLETLIDYDHKLTVEQKSKFLAIAYAETQRLNSLVNDVLDLSRLESECRYVLSPVGLISTVSYIIKASRIIALSRKVHIGIEAHTQVQKTLAHESSLCQVLSNLISNSLKFTHRGGKIIIRIYPLLISDDSHLFCGVRPEFVRLEIIDEGVGIDKACQKQIFDRFMRIENNIHTLEGTGLGLSIVKNIIGKHNSLIEVYSEVGIGTSFWFDLLWID
jgi:two-component system sensor histidine kinase NblS